MKRSLTRMQLPVALRLGRPWVALAAAAAVAVASGACAPRVQVSEAPRLISTDEERAANRAALEQLTARAPEPTANRAASLDATDALPLLPVTVVEPPPTAAERGEGQIARHDLREFLEQGPQAVIQAIQVEPEMDGNTFIGFRIQSVDPAAEAFHDSGLRAGDVVTAVNGIDISHPEGFMQAWDSLAEADHLNVDIIRQGRAQTLAWQIR
jgi:hypothetical protein